jgi:broad specificity phosphatase PhoE
LTDRGQAQARCLAKRLQNEGIQKIVCSPYVRTIQTANAVADLLDLPLYLDYGIQEWFGETVLVDERQPLRPAELKEMFPRIDTSYQTLHPVRSKAKPLSRFNNVITR